MLEKAFPDVANRDNEKIYTDHFEVYRGKSGDHLIDVNKNGKRRYYTTKDISEGSLRAPSTGTFENVNNIITNSNSNLNPRQKTNSKTSFSTLLEELRRKRRKRG